MDAVIVDKDSVHLKICLLTVFLLLELNESVLQAISCAFIANNLAAKDLAKA